MSSFDLFPPSANRAGVGFSKYPGDTGVGLGGADALFKDYYEDGIRDLLNSTTILKKVAFSNRIETAGAVHIMTIRTGRNEGGGFIAEGGRIPRPQRQRYKRVQWETKYAYHRLAVTGQALASSRNSRGAFTDVLNSEIVGSVQDRAISDNQLMYSNGAGVWARVAAGVTGTTVQVKDPGGFQNPGFGTQYLRPGMEIGFADPATPGTIKAVGIIDSVDAGAGTITMGASVTVATNDVIFTVSDSSIAAGSQVREDTSLGNSIWGLAALINDDNAPDFPAGFAAGSSWIGGLDATAAGNEVWNAYVVDNAGTDRPFEPDLIEQGENGVNEISGTQVDMLLASYGIRRQYLTLLQQNKRYPNTMKMDAGWDALDYNGRPLLVDKDMTRGRIYGISKETLRMFVEADYQFRVFDGGGILRASDEFDQYFATLFGYWNIGIDARNRNFVIKDILDV